MLLGGEGNDTLAGFGGNDAYDGGGGDDLVQYNDDGIGVFVDLAAGFAQTANGYDTLTSIEIIHGSAHAADTIFGSAAVDQIFGEFGDDILVGRGGDDRIDGGRNNDTIEGDEGEDLLTGGEGVDRFVYRKTGDAGDVITDF